MATMQFADVYGGASTAGSVFNPGAGQVTGPNPSSVTGAGQVGATPTPAGSGAAFSWLGFVLALVVLRIALETKGE
jgi:hypothetical protein